MCDVEQIFAFAAEEQTCHDYRSVMARRLGNQQQRLIELLSAERATLATSSSSSYY